MVRVTLSIATQLMQQKEYVRALQVLTEVIDKPYAGDAELLSALGRCHLEVANMCEAKMCRILITIFITDSDMRLGVGHTRICTCRESCGSIPWTSSQDE